MAQHPRPIELTPRDDRLFPKRFDVVRISLVIEIHNITTVSDARLRVYGGPHGETLLSEDWLDVGNDHVDLLWSDLSSAICTILDEHSGPF